MVLLAGLALWAVRASVWFGLALPVAICALARERAPRAAAAGADLGPGWPPPAGWRRTRSRAGCSTSSRGAPTWSSGWAQRSSRRSTPASSSSPAERWREYLAIAAGRWDAERLLGTWGIDYVVTGERRTPSLTALLAASGRWRLAFSHGDERVYVRVAPRPTARLPPRAR
jgi:hypothetical protein